MSSFALTRWRLHLEHRTLRSFLLNYWHQRNYVFCLHFGSKVILWLGIITPALPATCSPLFLSSFLLVQMLVFLRVDIFLPTLFLHLQINSPTILQHEWNYTRWGKKWWKNALIYSWHVWQMFCCLVIRLDRQYLAWSLQVFIILTAGAVTVSRGNLKHF